jgi:3-oxoadipate enol-lactonase
VDAYLERSDARLAYRVEGGGDATPVVVAHAFLASRELEDSAGVFDWARDGRRLIRFDARGHGASSGVADQQHYRWPALSEDLLAVLDATAPGDAAVDAIGESTGCGSLLWAVVRAPQRFRRLVLVIPPTMREERQEQAKLYFAAADLVELRGEEAWARLVDTFPPVPLLVEGGWASPRTIPVTVPLLPSVLRGAASSDLPPDDVLATVQQPVLILSWASDANHPTLSAERLAAVLPDSTLEVATVPDDVRGWGGRVAAFLAAG